MLELLNWIVVVHIVQFELLNDNQNEKVQHDIGDDHDKDDVVGGCARRATIDTLNAVRRRVHTVIHQLVPIFTC